MAESRIKPPLAYFASAGVALWRHTFGQADDVGDALRLMFGWANNNHGKNRYATLLGSPPGSSEEEAEERDAELGGPAKSLLHLWAARWAGFGFPRVVFESARHASALMCSRLAAVEESIRLPWDAFVITLPPGLLSYGPDEVANIAVHGYPGQTKVFGLIGDGATSISCSLPPFPRPPNEARDGPKDEEELPLGVARWVTDSEEVKRWRDLVERLLVGTCLEFAYRASDGKANGGVRTNQRPPGFQPKLTSFVLKRPISIDCSGAVREYLKGDRERMATVQTLVRGHWKMQPHGTGRDQRKLIFVEPYWRGPDGAPIAVRPHLAGPSGDQR